MVHHFASDHLSDMQKVHPLAWGRHTGCVTTGSWETLCKRGRGTSTFMWHEPPHSELCKFCKKIVAKSPAVALKRMEKENAQEMLPAD